MNKEFVFTPENLADNIDRLGAWSAYGLACEALNHYFPKQAKCETNPVDQAKLLSLLGCEYWQDLVIKYHKEVGYKHLDSHFVNEY